MRRLALVTAVCAAAGLAVPALAAGPGPAGSAPRGAAAWQPRPATYTVVTQHNVPIRMDDGVVLRADVLRPGRNGQPAPGRFPVILTQTPYNKNIPDTNFANDYLVERGYIQVIVDVRGTGSSGGTWTSFGPREQRDYYETAVWAHRLPGGDGSVGLYGISYGAIAAMFTAAENPPGLAAAFPIVPMADAYRDVAVSGGQLDAGFIPFWLGLVTVTGLLPPTDLATDPTGLLTVLEHVVGVTRFQLPALLSAALGRPVDGYDGAYDGPFYDVRSPLEVIDRVRVPTFIVGGEYDLFQRGEPLLYRALRANHVPTRLLIGPWTHLQAASGTGLPADGVPTLSVLELRWFDHYLRGLPDPTLDRDVPPVTYYRLGAGRYETASDYPPPDTGYQLLPLGGSASPGRAGTLGGRPTAGTGTVPYVPVAGACSESTSQWTAGLVPAAGPCADQQLNDFTGVAYDLPVTGAGLRFAGTSMAALYVSTTGRDALLSVRLEDVAPDGSVTPITAGWQVLSLRALDPGRSGYADGLLVQPWHPDTQASVLPVAAGRVYQVDVEIFPTAAFIAPGHLLRLTVQAADFPHLAAPLPQLAGEAGQTVTVYAGAAHQSELVLGVES